MAYFDEVNSWYSGLPYRYAQGGRITPDQVGQPIQHHTVPGSPEYTINFGGSQWTDVDKKWIAGMLGEVSKTPAQKAEGRVRSLDIQPGDRVRLTAKDATDPSQIEGEVLGVKDKGGQVQIRIKGFGHTGSKRGDGGQYVWFVAADYKVEVLHRAYRWTQDDELVVQVAGLPRQTWEKYKDSSRETMRAQFADRVERIKRILADDANRG